MNLTNKILFEVLSNFNDNFKTWFKNSKVIDLSGSPMIVYHGTNKKFNSFNFDNAPQKIIWFTNDKSTIEKGESGASSISHIMPLYVSMQNPAGWNEYDKYSLFELEQLGYDGALLVDNDIINGFVFNPTQVKSVNNDGSWSPSSKNIYK